MICGHQHDAMAYRPQPDHGPHEPMLETFPVTLYCQLPEGHDGAHACRLPQEAGDDAGKTFEWPAR